MVKEALRGCWVASQRSWTQTWSKPDQHKAPLAAHLDSRSRNWTDSRVWGYSILGFLRSCILPPFCYQSICFLFSPFFLCRVAFLLLLPTAQTWLPYFFIFSLHIQQACFIHLPELTQWIPYSWGTFHCVYVPQLPYQLPASGRRGCFCVLAIVSGAAASQT